MSQKTRLKQSRDQWRQKAKERAEKCRYANKELKRVKKERDRLKSELKETRDQLNQKQTPILHCKVEVIFVALQLFLVGRISFRAVSRVLGLLANLLGIKKAPCPQTIINWVTRLSLVRMQSALPRVEPPLSLSPFSNGSILILDTTIALGAAKILPALALGALHHQNEPTAPGLGDVRCIGVSVAESWTGESIAAFLKRIIATSGRPSAYLKDGGTDLQKAVRLLDEQGLGSPCIDDISHVVANLLKRWYGEHPKFETFVSACGRASTKLKQTALACLAPPKVQTKSRFMNLHRLIGWADKLLKLSPVGAAAKGSMLSRLRACFDKLPECRDFIKRFRDDAAPLLKCQEILKTRGLSHESLAFCEPHIQSIPSAALRREFQDYLDRQLEIAKKLGLDSIGMPISSDPIESLFAVAKQHGVAQIKDADQIAMRLPALCGAPTLEEARQVLTISVEEQNKLTSSFTSLTKQRREVLCHPDRLESLGQDDTVTHMEMIPSTKNRSKNQKAIEFPVGYEKKSDPLPECRMAYG